MITTVFCRASAELGLVTKLNPNNVTNITVALFIVYFNSFADGGAIGWRSLAADKPIDNSNNDFHF
ncbi:MAG: hypothetical protein PHQ05_09115 [Sterolibacterium sp.]|nr:hypothetical protein [Sterolibacterium sp.]